MQRPSELQAALLALQRSASAKEELRPRPTAAARLSMDTVLNHHRPGSAPDSGVSTRGSMEDAASLPDAEMRRAPGSPSTSEPQAARPSMDGSEASGPGSAQAVHQDLPTQFRSSEDGSASGMAAALAAFGILPANGARSAAQRLTGRAGTPPPHTGGPGLKPVRTSPGRLALPTAQPAAAACCTVSLAEGHECFGAHVLPSGRSSNDSHLDGERQRIWRVGVGPGGS